MNRSTFFQVAPRYTPGSPAQVDEATARRVARREVQVHGGLGLGDPPDTGLAGIVEAVTELADGSRIVTDLITGTIQKIRPVKPGRAARTPVTDRAALAKDVRALHDLLARRGADWVTRLARVFGDGKPAPEYQTLDPLDPRD